MSESCELCVGFLMPIIRRQLRLQKQKKAICSTFLPIRGEIVVRAPQGPVHASCVRRLNTLFSRRLFEHGVEVVEVSVQLPLAASEHDAPEPDVALLRIADYADRHPDGSDVLLAVEVAVCARATTNVPATTSSAPRRPSRSGASVKKRKPQSAAKTIWT